MVHRILHRSFEVIFGHLEIMHLLNSFAVAHPRRQSMGRKMFFDSVHLVRRRLTESFGQGVKMRFDEAISLPRPKVP